MAATKEPTHKPSYHAVGHLKRSCTPANRAAVHVVM